MNDDGRHGGVRIEASNVDSHRGHLRRSGLLSPAAADRLPYRIPAACARVRCSRDLRRQNRLGRFDANSFSRPDLSPRGSAEGWSDRTVGWKMESEFEQKRCDWKHCVSSISVSHSRQARTSCGCRLFFDSSKWLRWDGNIGRPGLRRGVPEVKSEDGSSNSSHPGRPCTARHCRKPWQAPVGAHRPADRRPPSTGLHFPILLAAKLPERLVHRLAGITDNSELRPGREAQLVG
jgi:hypothetical protein